MRALAIALLLGSSRVAVAQLLDPSASPSVELTPPSVELQTSSNEDVVTLRDGTILHGHVVELRPGDHVELVLIDGRAQTIAWRDIVSSIGPSFPSQRPSLAQRHLEPAPGRVPVELASRRRPITVGVMRMRPLLGEDSMTFDDNGYVSQSTINYQSRSGTVVCAATPCRIYARPGPLRLQVSGDKILSYSDEVVVPEGGAHVDLRAPDVVQRRIGAAIALNSLTAMLVGGLVMGLGNSLDVHKGIDEKFHPSHPALYYGVGGAIIGAGVGMAVAGIVLWARNRRGVDAVTPLDRF